MTASLVWKLLWHYSRMCLIRWPMVLLANACIYYTQTSAATHMWMCPLCRVTFWSQWILAVPHQNPKWQCLIRKGFVSASQTSEMAIAWTTPHRKGRSPPSWIGTWNPCPPGHLRKVGRWSQILEDQREGEHSSDSKIGHLPLGRAESKTGFVNQNLESQSNGFQSSLLSAAGAFFHWSTPHSTRLRPSWTTDHEASKQGCCGKCQWGWHSSLQLQPPQTLKSAAATKLRWLHGFHTHFGHHRPALHAQILKVRASAACGHWMIQYWIAHGDRRNDLPWTAMCFCTRRWCFGGGMHVEG